ncbi:MAG TPA: hypothetical protein VKR83_11825 [Ktedonobacteraceae bacterium]|nr:hypothetical protein [Ktedonobacteraceae bacterium]
MPVVIPLVILVIAGILLTSNFFAPWWVESQLARYTSFNGSTFAAQISVKRTGTNNTSQLLFSIPVGANTMGPDTQYLLHCKEWRLDANIITIASWINMPSHTWYQLTQIEGSRCYNQHGKAIPAIDIKLPGSNDSFGEAVQNHEEVAGLVSAKDIASNFVQADGKTYNVTVSQNAIFLTATS